MNLSVRTLSILTALALAGTALPAFAETVLISATLSGAEEVPANDAPGTGTVDGTYDTETNLFTFRVDYSGLTGDATAAHFHGPAAVGANAPPSLPIDGALASPIVGTATLSDAQEAELLGGMWYFNVHTAQYPDGELRGQVMQSMSSMESSMMSSEESSMSSEEPSSASSSELSSAVSSVSSELSSILDPSVSVSASASVSGEVSVTP